MYHHNHERPFGPSPTGGDSHSISSYLEQAHPHLDSTFSVFRDTVSNDFPNTYPAAQRSIPLPYQPPYNSPAQQQQQQTHSPRPTYPSNRYQQLSDARYHSGLAYDGSYNHTYPIYRDTTYTHSPSTSLSPVLYDVPPGIHWQQPTIKKRRKRADARQLEVLNRMYALTAFPSTEERYQLARELDMSARRVEIWFQNKRQASRQAGRSPTNSSISKTTVTLSEDKPPVIHPRRSPAPMGSLGESLYPSRSPPPAIVRSGQTPSPPLGRSAPNPAPTCRQSPGRGY